MNGNNTLRTALIGCGNISSKHLDAVCKNENIILVAVCDIDRTKADSVADKYSVKAFYNIEDLLSWGEFDVLHICTPHYLHPKMAIDAMKSGKHVLCEKPLAIKYEDAVKMCECAEENNVYLGTCFQNRYNEQSVYLKKLTEDGSLGKILSVKGIVTWDRGEDYYNADDWHGTLDKEGGGVVINQSIHTIDLMQWLVDSDAVSVKGSISQKRLEGKVETEDTADALITFENGVKALFYGTLCYNENSPVFLEIKYEKGRAVMYDELTVYRDNAEREVIDFTKAQGEKAYWGNSHEILIDEFYESIIGNKPFEVCARSGIKAVKIVDGFYSSAKK